MISISFVMPRDPEALTVQKLREIRQSSPVELNHFRSFLRAVAECVPPLGEAADPAAVAAHLAVAFEQEIRPQLTALEAQMRGRAIDTVQAALGASIAMPAILADVPIPQPVEFATAAFFSLFPIVRAKRRDAKQALAASPAALLYRLDHELTPKSLLGRIAERVRSFLTGL